MYSGSGFKNWEIGDIDVFVHNGKYHLFHLIIPNHDYIAHAVSDDCINWRREKNALFVGHPGEWDDDMLWTMNVSQEGDTFIMYYTGLKREDQGQVQKIGKAISTDLIHWEKCKDFTPLRSKPPYYECVNSNNPREWLSFRDPFLFEENNEKYLIICARQSWGTISRRGCVGLAKLNGKGKFELQKPLFSPMVYDDVECPCLIKIKDTYYLLGSIREDLKVRYWVSKKYKGEYYAFHNNVLLPQGSYAARIVKDGEHILINNFYFIGHDVNTHRVIAPPKELDVDNEGRLILKPFYKWEEKVYDTIQQDDFPVVKKLLNNPTGSFLKEPNKWIHSSKSGFEIFGFIKPYAHFIWEGHLQLQGIGKCGFILHSDEYGNGYYISLDMVNGFIQIRRWGFISDNKEQNFIFENLQINQFKISENREMSFQLISFGSYIEFSIDGIVILSLIDYYYSGDHIGIYTSSSITVLKNSIIKQLKEPEREYGTQIDDVETFNS